MKILILLTTLSFGIIAQATNEDDPTKKDDRTCQYRFAKRKGTAGTPQPIPRAQRQRIDLEKSRPIPPVRPENKKNANLIARYRRKNRTSDSPPFIFHFQSTRKFTAKEYVENLNHGLISQGTYRYTNMSVSTWMHFYDIPKFDELMRRVLKVNIDNVVTRVPEVIKKIAQSHSAFSSYATEEMLERHLFHPFRIQWGVAARDLGTSLSLMKHKKQNDSSYATTSLLNKIEIQMKDFLNPGNKVTLPSENDKPEEVKDFRHPIIAYFERILEEESNHRIKNPEKEQERQLRIPFIVQLIDIIEGDMKSGIIEETPGLISPELRMQIQNVNSTTVKPEGISIFVRDAIYKTPR